MITVDEPGAGAYYAGQVAAPYAKPLFTSIFNYMENKFENENKNALAKDIVIPEVRGMKFTEAKKILTEAGLECELPEGNDGVVKTMKPYPGYTVKEGAKITLYSNDDGGSSTSIVMPDLNGYSEEAATELLKALGLKYSISGSGAVSSQSVPTGEVITNTITIKLELKKTVED